MKRWSKLHAQTLRWVVVGLVLSACGSATSIPTSTIAPSATPVPSETAVPSPTIVPTPMLKSGQEIASVIEVIDGVTIIVEINGEEVTLCYDLTHMYDFPPYDQLADEAEAENRAMVEDQIVIMEKRDKGRTEDLDCIFRFVFLEDGTFVNAEMLRRGFAYFAGLSSWKYTDELEAAELEAIDNVLGMWKLPTSSPVGAPTSEHERFGGDIRITDISYMGVSDEYIEILYKGWKAPAMVDFRELGGWQIFAEGTGMVFVFPLGVEIYYGATCRIYTGEAKMTCDGRELSFRSSREVWQNEGDCAYLFNAEGGLESKYCY
ncbi:MAG: hypothetical protein GTO18_00250 [Anaerolineales bacterium]|nr:hypothetical protein [Anaerolineales bacterium]